MKEVGNSSADSLDKEMGIILAVAAVIIFVVLLFTSHSYAEIPVLLITFVAAALLNMGTNFLCGEISFVSNSVTVVLQLALAIDYAIIMLHRFLEERERADVREACIAAVSAAIPSISASSLTTISGLAAMMFMQFRIGFDMGMVLIKAILFSMISVFTLMPGLLIVFSGAIEKTKHRNFVPRIDRWADFTVKMRYVCVPVFLICAVAGCVLSNYVPYVYGYSQLTTYRQNENQIAEQKIDEVFGDENTMALLVPRGDYDSEKALLERLENYEEVDYAMGLSNIEALQGYTLTDDLTPREFSEMTDLDYEQACLLYSAYAAEQEEYGRIVNGVDEYTVPLMDMFSFVRDCREEGYITLEEDLAEEIDALGEQLDDARAQMLGDHYSRIVINLNLPEESEETFDFLQTIHREAEQYYEEGDIYLVGDSTSDYDLSVSFARDNIMISVLSVLFVIIVLLFTFQSVGLPVLLILVIQGSIWMNFAFSAVTQTPIFFMSYLIVTAIQMGANIDYAIVISTWYEELKQSMPKRDAVHGALNLAFPTVLTSGSILASAGFLIARITTEPTIVGIGECLCRGTLISILLVMFILPQLLILGDKIVKKTRFNVKVPKRTHNRTGLVYVDGRVRGKIHGTVDASMRGFIRGEISAVLENSDEGTSEDSGGRAEENSEEKRAESTEKKQDAEGLEDGSGE